MSTTIRGMGAAGGVALGPALLVEEGPSRRGEERSAGTAAQEEERLRAALDQARRELEELAERVGEDLGDEEAEIFRAQAGFAADPELLGRATGAIGEGLRAEEAAGDAFARFRQLLSASSSDYLSARVADLDDVRERVLDALAGGSSRRLVLERAAVVVAQDLTPSQTAGLPREHLLGIVTEDGAPTSHAAVLARALGVPAVVGAEGATRLIRDGVEVGVDGSAGEVVVEPDAGERARFAEAREQAAVRRERLGRLREEPGRTADGRRVELAANIGSIEDLEPAQEVGAEGSGLVRTEFLFLERQEPPDVSEQATVYAEILDGFPGQRVVFRTLDAGADKPLAFVGEGEEPNPALGVRGIRLGLRHPSLLKDQLRAVCRAAGHAPATRTAVMFPMVSTVAEVDQAVAVLSEAAREEGMEQGAIEVGVMIEVPAAALAVERLAGRLGFVSIGTNDLLQYLYAADRLVPGLAELPDLLDPAVLRFLDEVVEGAHRGGAWVGVCGEAAGVPLTALALVGLGADELSMAPGALPEVKSLLRGLGWEEIRSATEQARAAGHGGEAQRILEELAHRAGASE